MGRDVKLLSAFPWFMRAGEGNGALKSVCSVLGIEIDSLDEILYALLKNRRITEAKNHDAIMALGKIAGMDRSDFTLEMDIYEAGMLGNRDADGYDHVLSLLRNKVVRTAALISQGCGTVWALLEGASLLLSAENALDETNNVQVEHLFKKEDGTLVPSRNGFIHTLTVCFSYSGQPEQEHTLYLIENPLTTKATEKTPRYQYEFFRLKHLGFEAAAPAIHITGCGERTMIPMVTLTNLGMGVGYAGQVPDGQTLTFLPTGTCLLDETDVTDTCFSFQGELLTRETGPEVTGSYKELFAVSQPPGALDRPVSVHGTGDPLTMPPLPLGESTWSFSVREGAFDADAFDRCVFELPHNDMEVRNFPPSGIVDMEWKYRAPFEVTLLLPAALGTMDGFPWDKDLLVRRIEQGLKRFRAAGIHVKVDMYTDELFKKLTDKLSV